MARSLGGVVLDVTPTDRSLSHGVFDVKIAWMEIAERIERENALTLYYV